MKCESCECEISEDESFEFNGKKLCEDCYMDAQIDASQQSKVCDPMAVQLVKSVRKTLGQEGVEGLTKLQQEIYEYIKTNGQALPKDITKKFNITLKELENQIAVLRHCELVKGKQVKSDVYLVLF